MSWRNQLQKAEFRGQPFYVSGGDAQFGRRVQRAEQPGGDRPFTEDLGRRAREFNVEAILLDQPDQDLFTQRRNLLAALEAPGPAELIHPRFGKLRAQVEQVRWSSTTGGSCERINITFVETNATAAPTVAIDTLSQLEGAADQVELAQQNFFARQFEILQQPDFIFDAAKKAFDFGMNEIRKLATLASPLTEAITGVIKQVDAGLDTVNEVLETVNDAIETVQGVVDQVDRVIQLAKTVDDEIKKVIRGVLAVDEIERVLEKYRTVKGSWEKLEQTIENTPSRRIEAANQAAIAQLFTTSATVEVTRLIARQSAAVGVTSNARSPFDSADQAYAVRDELVRDLEAIALTADDGLFAAIQDLQAALVVHIDAHGNALPRVSRASYGNDLPMLVIAHHIYGADELVLREEDLIARNRIRHPLFVPAGRVLEVLHGG